MIWEEYSRICLHIQLIAILSRTGVVFKRINLADNENERKQAMKLLSDFSGYSLSEQDFVEFMKGNKQIEL